MRMVTQAEVVEAHGGLRRVGTEWTGHCPLCDGHDRFYVRANGHFFCRQCLPDGSDAHRYVDILKALNLYEEPHGEVRGWSLAHAQARNERIDPFVRDIAECARDKERWGARAHGKTVDQMMEEGGIDWSIHWTAR